MADPNEDREAKSTGPTPEQLRRLTEALRAVKTVEDVARLKPPRQPVTYGKIRRDDATTHDRVRSNS
jgi:hypothetical protein